MSERLTLQDLIDLLSEKQNITKKDAETFLRELVGLISETIEGKDFVRMKDFGTFKLTKVNSRRSVDVNTGDPIEIPAHYKLSFTPDKVLREGVNKPFSHFESISLPDENGDVVFKDKKEEPKAAAPKVAPVKAEPVKEEPKKEEPKKEAPKEVEKVVAASKEEVKDKVEEVLEKTSDVKAPAKEVIASADLDKKEKLADIDSFVAKETEPKKEVKPLVTAKESPTPKEEAPVRRSIRQTDEDDDDFYDYDAGRKKKRNLWIGIGAIALILCAVAFWWLNGNPRPEPVPFTHDNEVLIVEDTNVPSDNGAEEELTPVVGEEPIATPVEEELAPVVVVDEVAAAPISKGAIEIEVETGQTMRALGSKYFGHGSFWVYIFEENRDRVKSPDAVFAGMKLIIPPASKYDIDANDKASVRKAQREEMKLFGEFSDK